MYVEFVCPPDSYEVVGGAEMDTVPRLCERVEIKDKHYRVYNVQWIYLDSIDEPDKCVPIVNLIKDEIEEYTKKKSRKA